MSDVARMARTADGFGERHPGGPRITLKSSIMEYNKGWEGKYASLHLPAKEVAKLLRDYIRADKDLNRCKWSIKSGWASYEYTLDISLMTAPFDPFSDEFKKSHPNSVRGGYTQHGKVDDFLSPECQKVMHKVRAFVSQYNWDRSDSMTDYFDRHIYDSYSIGQYNKPFERTEPKKSVKTASVHVDGLQVIDYSEKAVAVIGETKAVKDRLREMGGRFNARLSCGPGWIFSKSKKDEITTAFGL